MKCVALCTCAILAACAHHAPAEEAWMPCDVSQHGPHVAPPYDGSEPARLRAAEIVAALLELRERIDAMDPACARLATRSPVADQDAAALAACVGVTADLPPLVIMLRDRHVEEIDTSVQLVPHGELVAFRAAQYPVDCAPPEWAVDWTAR
jgi:hypothetical protein